MMNRNAGFTLIELIVTMALAAIILTIGVPSFREALQNNRRATQINEIISTFNIARSEAIKRGVQVTLCKSTNGTSCNTTACDASTGNNCWEQGWITFSDSDGDGTVDAVITTTEDGATVIAVDEDGDGNADVIMIDEDGDGTIDVVALLDENGEVIEAVVVEDGDSGAE